LKNFYRGGGRFVSVSPLSLNYFLQLSAHIHHRWKNLRPEKLPSKSVVFTGSPLTGIQACQALEKNATN
jgi:hypothetical protein